MLELRDLQKFLHILLQFAQNSKDKAHRHSKSWQNGKNRKKRLDKQIFMCYHM